MYIMQAMWNVTLLSDFKVKLRSITDCSFLYWNPELFSAFLKDVYSHPEQAHRLQYIVSAFADPGESSDAPCVSPIVVVPLQSAHFPPLPHVIMYSPIVQAHLPRG